MQIEKIAFKNINNLKGEHLVNFSEAPLKDAGMFAIVGPTGSGKSTLLDVITLALFNRIPRFTKALTKTEMEGSGSVMTRNTSDAYAAVDYTIKNKRYTSKWAVARTKKGNLKDYHMDIYSHSTGSFLDLKKSAVPHQNMDIIGLDYSQFIKSIILSQGQFAEFLKADKNVRGQLLENITGSKIYRILGKRAYDKNKQVKERIERHRERQGDILLLPQEEVAQINELMTSSKNDLKTKNERINELTQLKQVKQEYTLTTTQLKIQESDFSRLIESIIDFKQSEAKLELHHKISPASENIGIYRKTAHSIKTLKTKQETELKNIKEATKKLNSIITEMATLTKQEVNEGNFIQVMKLFEEDINTMDADLRNIKKNGQQIREEVNTQVAQCTSKIKNELLKNIKPNVATDLINARLAALPQHHSSTQDAQHNLMSLTQKLNDTKEKQRDLTKLAENLKELDDKKLKEKKLVTNQKQTTEKGENNKAQLQVINETLAKYNTHKENLEKQRAEAQKLFNLKDYRKELKDGDACPLCGSLEHPYRAHSPIEQDGYEIELKKTKIAITEKEKEKEATQKIVTICSSTLSNILTQLEELQAKMAPLQKTLEKNAVSLNIHLQKPESLNEAIKEVNRSVIEIEQAAQSIIEHKELLSINNYYTKLTKIASDFLKLDAQRKSKFEGASVSDICNDLQDKFGQASNIIITSQKSISDSNLQLKEEVNIKETINKRLAPLMAEYGVNDADELNNMLLQPAEVDLIKSKSEKLSTQKTKLETEIKTLTDKIADLTLKDTQSQIALEKIILELGEEEKSKETLINQMGALEEKLKQDTFNRQRVETFQKELNQLMKDQEKWALLNRIIGDATGNKFANFAQGLTLNNLIVLANKRLQRLSERYLLTMPEGDGLLQVVDIYQGNSKRAVNTLSGGESFMVSLALALSLSDMASKNVALDSLFIDEGFGTLDADTLEMAIDTLEKMQTESQKTVGVISHVRALQERISVQIQLKKNSHGYSQIELVG